MLEEQNVEIKNEEQVNEIVNDTFSSDDSGESNQIVIKYSRPKFVHRVLANFLDIFFFALVFVLTFIISRSIISNTPQYKATFNSINNMRLESGMYYDDGNRLVDIVSYMRGNTNYNDNAIVIRSEKSIDQFFTFEMPLVSEKKYLAIKDEYDKLRLEKTVDSVHLFVIEGENIVKNQTLYEEKKSPFASFYCNYIDKYLQGYLVSTPKYYDATRQLSTYLLWVEIPVSFASGLIFIYFLPTVIFVRGRSTFGKAIYRIGSVDSRYLSPTFWRNLAKFGLFSLEMIAGIASLGLIFILSTTLMAFSKKRQGFPDYMLGLQEVDMSKNKIYKSMDEAQFENINTHKKATDFRLIERP